jgi:hypothetical protein
VPQMRERDVPASLPPGDCWRGSFSGTEPLDRSAPRL